MPDVHVLIIIDQLKCHCVKRKEKKGHELRLIAQHKALGSTPGTVRMLCHTAFWIESYPT